MARWRCLLGPGSILGTGDRADHSRTRRHGRIGARRVSLSALVRDAGYLDHGSRPERLESGVRKWLTYLSLLGTAGAMICDLICFLDYFLTGELTVRFVLKAATVMLIAGAVFAYYLGSLRWRARSRAFGAAAAMAVIASFSIG